VRSDDPAAGDSARPWRADDVRCERGIDRGRGEDRLEHHDGGAGDAGFVAEPAEPDLQPSRCQWQGSLVHDLAYAGDERLAGLGDVATDDDHRRIEKVDARRQYTADGVAGLTNDADRVGLAGEHLVDDVAARFGLAAELLETRCHRRSAGEATARDADYFGSAVTRAARISAAAGPGEILASAELVVTCGGTVPVAGERTLELKGIAKPQTAMLIAWNEELGVDSPAP